MRKFKIGDIIRIKESVREVLKHSGEIGLNEVAEWKAANWEGVIVGHDDTTWPWLAKPGNTGRGSTADFKTCELELVLRPKSKSAIANGNLDASR